LPSRQLVVLLLALILPLAVAGTAGGKSGAAYQTGFDRFDDFSSWTGAGTVRGASVTLGSGAVTETDPYLPGAYNGGNFYTGGSYLVGEAVSPETTTAFGFTEAIASWNADTPAGTWIETLIRAKVGSTWTKYYNLGIWASGTETISRHSVNLQGDANGFVAVDTLILSGKKAPPATAYQVKLRLFRSTGSATPTVRSLSVATSTTAVGPSSLQAGNPALWGTNIALPECSQMVYPDGGEVWCSPTSTSMVLGGYGFMSGPCEPRVRHAVAGVFDWVYDGHGNWPFNTAYAAANGFEGYVARFESFAEVEPWLAAGVPVVISYPWKKGELDGAPIPSSNGHLAVIVGFDGDGNPIVNDPAAASNDAVTRTYDRAQLETLWLEHSGGTSYLIYPTGTTGLPALDRD
jgi:Peptidase_C39 like family